MGNSRKLAYLANLINNTGNIPITTISDIDISSVANNQSLVYDTVTGKWKNGTGSGASTPSALSDQQNTSTGYFMIPNGTTAQRPVSAQYGALRYNTTTGFAEVYTSGGWTVMGAPPPVITTVTPSTYSGESGTTFTINGSNFTSDAIVKFIDVNNTEYTATLTTLINSTQLTATTPQDFTVAQEPLDVRVIQLSGTVTRLDCIDTGGIPGWSTSAGQIGGNIYRNASVNTSVAATDSDANATLVYSVLSGTLPSGLSLNPSTGAITGTAPNVGSDTTYNFTLRVTDNAGNTADRAFSMIVLQGAPGTPTIGTATVTGSNSATVTFTAPANTGGSTITTYTAVSNPGGITGTLSQPGSGTITVNGLSGGTSYTFTVYATNSYGNSSSSSASNSITTPQAAPSSVEYLVVAGGGGGGCVNGGGGGAGGYRTSTLSVAASTGYTVTVGGGGSGAGSFSVRGGTGSDSVFSSITSNGGGGGGTDTQNGNNTGGAQDGAPGGSGGGSWYGGGVGGAGTAGQGNAGGACPGNGSIYPFPGGGGGGAGAAGTTGGNTTSTGGNGAGGIGAASSITGTSTYYAGGGTGGTSASNIAGGAGGGGTGGAQNGTKPGGAGGTNLGGGGGGGWSTTNDGSGGGTGGSGVVIIAYPDSFRALSSIGGGLSYNQPSRSGYRVYRFTGGTGTISW
jgi:hypothetical protein